MEGTKKAVAIMTKNVVRAKKDMETDKEICSARKLLIGTPTTMPADTPMFIFATAFGAAFTPATSAAIVKAMEQ